MFLKFTLEYTRNTDYTCHNDYIKKEYADMVQEVLDILTNNLTNERFDSILQQNSEYVEITERVHKSLQELEKITADRKEVQKIIDKYDVAVHEESALLIKLAYQQGMKDFAQLLLSLI